MRLLGRVEHELGEIARPARCAVDLQRRLARGDHRVQARDRRAPKHHREPTRRQPEPFGQPTQRDLFQLGQRGRGLPQQPDVIEPRGERLGQNPRPTARRREITHEPRMVPVRDVRKNLLLEIRKNRLHRLTGLGRGPRQGVNQSAGLHVGQHGGVSRDARNSQPASRPLHDRSGETPPAAWSPRSAPEPDTIVSGLGRTLCAYAVVVAPGTAIRCLAVSLFRLSVISAIARTTATSQDTNRPRSPTETPMHSRQLDPPQQRRGRSPHSDAPSKPVARISVLRSAALACGMRFVAPPLLPSNQCNSYPSSSPPSSRPSFSNSRRLRMRRFQPL